MERSKAINRMVEGAMFRYLIVGQNAHISTNADTKHEDSHNDLAARLELDMNYVCGGYLMRTGDELKHLVEATTVGESSQEMLDKVTDIEFF